MHLLKTKKDIENLSELLKSSLQRQNKSIAIGLADRSWDITYSQLHKSVEIFVNKLLQKGIYEGDVISIVLDNSIEFVIAFLAITWAKAIAAPLNPAYKKEEFDFYLNDQKCVTIINHYGEKAYSAANESAKNLEIPIWELKMNYKNISSEFVNIDILGSKIAEPAKLSSVDPENPALLLHTSGTTSKPKGVILTHKNLVTSICNIINTYELSPKDKTVLVMPLFHVHGLMAGLLSTLGSGGSVFIPPEGVFSASNFWNYMTKCNASWYTAVPTIHQILFLRNKKDYPNNNPPVLRFIRSSSSSLAPSLLEKLEDVFNAPILEAYSMTEAAHQMSSNPLPKNGPHKMKSVGKGQNVEIAILDNKNHILSIGQIGEICVKGENITPGYRNNKTANDEAFADGWFHTGDQGYLDNEDYLYLTGRIKELINRGGEKISPIEIDSVLMSNNKILEAVSFAAPDDIYGEEVNAAIILNKNEKLTEEELIEFCLSKLSSFKIPKKFYFCKDFPHTGSGKVQRRKVAEHFLIDNK
ncbi:MAG TPA: acyl--CoA ligase [Victivallales bacterium]|nr:acyl--CoA ligase [Victivallales bacterium]